MIDFLLGDYFFSKKQSLRRIKNTLTMCAKKSSMQIGIFLTLSGKECKKNEK